jgi:hypothetical protein
MSSIHVRGRRIGGIGATLFGLGLAANVVVFVRNFDTPGEVADYLETGDLVGRLAVLSIGLAGVGLLVYLSSLKTTLSEERAWIGDLALAAGALFVTVTWVASTVDLGFIDTVGARADYDLYLVLRGTAHFQNVLAAMAAVLMLGAVYAASRGTPAMPRWAATWTLVTLVASVALIVFGVVVLLLVPWSIALGVAHIRIRQEQPESAPAVAG